MTPGDGSMTALVLTALYLRTCESLYLRNKFAARWHKCMFLYTLELHVPPCGKISLTFWKHHFPMTGIPLILVGNAGYFKDG